MGGCIRWCAVLLVVGACVGDDGGDPTLPGDPVALCDGSDDLVLGYRRDSFWLANPVLTVSGLGHLYIDGHCRYWVRGRAGEVLSGTLDADQADDLTARIGLAYWEDYAGQWETGLADGRDIQLWHGSTFLSCTGCEWRPPMFPDLLIDIADALVAEEDALRSSTVALDGSIRLTALTDRFPPKTPPTARLWTLQPPLADFANQRPIVVDDPAVTGPLRALRDEEPYGTDGLPITDGADDGYYLLYAGDVMPFEAEEGGVPLPP